MNVNGRVEEEWKVPISTVPISSKRRKKKICRSLMFNGLIHISKIKKNIYITNQFSISEMIGK